MSLTLFTTSFMSFLNPLNLDFFRIQMYKYNAGGQNGNITFIWKIGDEIDQTQQHKTVKEVEKMIPIYESRIEAKETREKYSNCASLTLVLRRNLVPFLTGKVPQ